MCQDKPFCVFSETGPLKQVMLHRPGNELNRLTISNMSDLLFDDLIWLEQAQREHDEFADILRREGCEVLYFSECLADVLEDKEVRKSLIDSVFMSNVWTGTFRRAVKIFGSALGLASHLISGYSKEHQNYSNHPESYQS